MRDAHWTYDEWATNTVEKIVGVGMDLPDEHRADWPRLQIGLAIDQAYRNGRSGIGFDDRVGS